MRNLKKYGNMKGVLASSFVLLCVIGLYMGMNLFDESFAETSIGQTATYYKYKNRFKSGYKVNYNKSGSSRTSSKSDIGYMRLRLDGSNSNIINVYCALRGKTVSTSPKYYRYNFSQFYSSKSASWRTKLANIVMLYPPGSSISTLKNYLSTNYPTEYSNGGLSNLTAEEASVAFQTAVWVFTNGDKNYTAATGNSARNKRINTLHKILLQSDNYLKNINSNISAIDFVLNSDLVLNQSTGKYEASLKTATSGFNQAKDVVELTLSTNKKTVISSSSYTTNYTTSGNNTILNITFNDGVFALNADGKVMLASNSEVFDSIYITSKVKHGVTNKTVFVYKTSSSSYQNFVGVETVPVTSTSYINITAPAVSKISIEVEKINEEALSGELLSDAHLQLYRVDGTNSILIDEWLSSKDRKVIDNLQPGTYRIDETLYPEGFENSTKATEITDNNVYVSSGKEFTLTAGTHTKFYVHVLNKQTEIKLKKVDSSGNNYVSGATFAIVDFESGEVYRVPTTTTDDISIKNELDVGTYFFVELEAPTNYIKSDKAYRFTIGTPDPEAPTTIVEGEYANLTVVDADYNANTKIITIKNNEGLAISKKSIDEEAIYVIGATLTITNANGEKIDEWVTTAEDHVVTVNMPDGIYTLTETIPGPGYATAESIQFEMKNGKVINNVSVNMKDSPLNVCINKKAANIEGNLAGAQFELYDSSNQLVTSFTTTNESYCIPAVEVGLTPGKYILKETKAPKGYRASSDIEIVVNDTSEKQVYDVVNEVEVPITSLNTSNIIYIAILVMGITGIGLVCYYVKKYSY